MDRRGFIFSTAFAIGLSRRLFAAESSSGPSPVAQWNETLISAARQDATSPCLLSVKLALLHKAFHKGLPSLVGENPVASIQAASTIASTLYPGSEATFRELLSKQLSSLTGSVDTDERNRGAKVAQGILNQRMGDGVTTAQAYVPSDKPGQWRRTPTAFRPPELPRWAEVTKPFLLKKSDQFRLPPPPDMASPEYASAWDEVRRLGEKSSIERSEDQTNAARFWSDFSYTETPPGHWNAITRQLVLDKNLPLAEEARLFSLLNLAMADSAIACWDTKYHYNFWRPVTAINRADEDGNNATKGSASWESLLSSPPHPEYVSGHSVFSGAAAEILRHHFKTDQLAIHAKSDTLKEITRTFSSLSACAEEISASRVWGGIHFKFSTEAGIALGKNVAKECIKCFVRS